MRFLDCSPVTSACTRRSSRRRLRHPRGCSGRPGASTTPVCLPAIIRLLNLPSSPTRRRLLLLQAVSWLIFATFSLVYFRLRSPILAFVWTAGMYLLTIWSIWLAARLDTKVAWSFATLVAWLSLATLVAGYQVIYNRDPLFDTPALR